MAQIQSILGINRSIVARRIYLCHIYNVVMVLLVMHRCVGKWGCPVKRVPLITLIMPFSNTSAAFLRFPDAAKLDKMA